MKQFNLNCICCDTVVVVQAQDWGKAKIPVALCPVCSKTVPKAMLPIIYRMKLQIAELYNKNLELEKDIKRLYSAQQDMEEALFEAPN